MVDSVAAVLREANLGAGLGLAEITRAQQATSDESVDGGGALLADALNQLTLVWTAITGELERDEVLLVARTAADVGMRLRQAAVNVGLVKEDADALYVQPGPTQLDITNGLYALRRLVEAPDPEASAA